MKMKRRFTDEEKLKLVRQVDARQREQTAVEGCEQAGISYSNYTRWKNSLGSGDKMKQTLGSKSVLTLNIPEQNDMMTIIIGNSAQVVAAITQLASMRSGS